MAITVNGLDELATAARALRTFAPLDKFFVFEGQMGAGKTTFIKEFCRVLSVTDVVSSPTFSIVNEYDAAGWPVYHFDFYRLKNIQEAFDIGYEEYFYNGAVCLVEWAEKITEILPERFVKVTIETINETSRKLTFEQYGADLPIL